MSYDVIVVGAGPAGSNAAYHLAAAGRKVLVLEKEVYPRYKACAGGISMKARSLVDMEWDRMAESKPRTIVFSYRFPRSERQVRLEWKEPLVYMVMRDRFDGFLAERAQSAGAEIRFGTPVKSVLEEGEGVVVKTRDNKRIRASYVIGADGASSTVAKNLDLMKNRTFGVALSVEVGPRSGDHTSHDEIRVGCGSVPKGFCWAFPKAGHVSAGAATFGRVKNLNGCIDQYLDREGLAAEVLHQQGYLLPADGGKEKAITTHRTLLVGDAAGFVDPLTGEGICYALQSGALAARAIIRNDTPGQATSFYRERVLHEIRPELSAASRLAALYYPFAGLLLNLLRYNPRLAGSICDAMCGGGSYRRFNAEEFKWLKLARESLGNYVLSKRD